VAHKDLRRLYRDQGETVLALKLRTYPYNGDGIEALRAAAREMIAAPAA
jgi:hypothetical protein